jgi:lactate dehydrogenase-like 2-hydroxyacid dehydrogenase
MGVNLDNIDVAHATSRGMLVTNVPDYCVEEVSDHARIPFWCPCPRHGGEPLP